MSDIFEAVSANRAAAEEREKVEAQKAEAALAEYKSQKERVRIRRRKKATQSFILRGFTSVIFGFLMVLAFKNGLVDARVSLPCVVGLLCWASFWFGAWMQFMFSDGGLLNVFK